MQAGKAVFTEKPVAEETKAVERVYKLAEKVKRPMFCAFNRRFDPSFDAVYRQVRAGQLGQVHQIKLTSRDSPLPSEAYLKISGGILASGGTTSSTWVIAFYFIHSRILP